MTAGRNSMGLGKDVVGRRLNRNQMSIAPPKASAATEPTAIPAITPLVNFFELLLDPTQSDKQVLDATGANVDAVVGVNEAVRVVEATAVPVEVGLEPRLLNIHF